MRYKTAGRENLEHLQPCGLKQWTMYHAGSIYQYLLTTYVSEGCQGETSDSKGVVAIDAWEVTPPGEKTLGLDL